MDFWPVQQTGFEQTTQKSAYGGTPAAALRSLCRMGKVWPRRSSLQPPSTNPEPVSGPPKVRVA
eukprot:4351224-Alexandrium_andersonii.AAC.1